MNHNDQPMKAFATHDFSNHFHNPSTAAAAPRDLCPLSVPAPTPPLQASLGHKYWMSLSENTSYFITLRFMPYPCNPLQVVTSLLKNCRLPVLKGRSAIHSGSVSMNPFCWKSQQTEATNGNRRQQIDIPRHPNFGSLCTCNRSQVPQSHRRSPGSRNQIVWA